ncbi:MAG: hypothetical protein K2X27_03190 [Candidatus Obscuribacterales bacterium]|nr:hypothetical protein [Candidatus Obscuribacterales bacterium]
MQAGAQNTRKKLSRQWLYMAALVLFLTFLASAFFQKAAFNLAILCTTLMSALIFDSISKTRENFLKCSLQSLSRKTDASSDCLEVLKELSYKVSQLEKSNAEYKQEELLLSEFSDSVLLVLDKNAKVLAANQSMWRNWGLAATALQGQNFAAYLDLNSQNKLKLLLESAQKSKKSEESKLRINSPTKSFLVVLLKVEWSETKEVFFCLAEDISQQTLLQNIKHEYAAMLTHDLRSPLSALKISLEHLQDCSKGQVSPEIEKSLNSASSSLSQLFSLINKLIVLDQSESGELSLQKKMYPLESIVEEAISIVQALAGARSIQITKRIEDLVVWCDKESIIQVLINLLANAIRYSPSSGEIKILAKAHMQELELQIEDMGAGVPDNMKTVIFERYKTIEEQRNRQESSGLGLAVSKALISAHGGRIGVRDSKEGGAVFYFTLQLATEQEIG